MIYRIYLALLQIFNHIPYDLIDGSHPNVDGMNTLVTLMIKQIGGNEVNKFMHFETEKFNNIFCSHCGNEVKQSENFCKHCGKLLNEQYLKFEICPNCHQRGMMYADGWGYCICCSFNAEPVGWDDMIIDVVIEKSNKVKQLAMTAKKSWNSLSQNTNSTDDNVFDSFYIWNQSSMNIDDIKCFGLSFGDCPNINISFDGDKLIVCNRINPRDGGMNFLDDFFDDKTVNLTYEQRISIMNYLRSIDFSTWKTSIHTIEMLKLGFDVFYVSESFAITFNNGYTFVCHNPEYEEFKQLIDFLKSFCDNSWFEPYYGEKVDDGTVLLEETCDSNTDYVLLPSDMTRLLFDNTLKLYDVNTSQNIEIRNEKIDVGRNSECDIHIDNNYISQIHASFYHEDPCWFIMDKGSRNGTWLNDKKLTLNTKYKLYPNDVINLAKTKEYVFYKSIEDKEYKYNNDENSYEIKIGTVLNDRYELLKQIGSGGLSTVYLARDTRINKAWAVKIVKTEISNKVDPIRDSVIQEAQMLKSFSHPAIPSIVDIVACQNYVAIVMDYVEGETLESIVKEYVAQPVEKVVDWIKQICDVLSYLHTLNPPHIYCDMKPGNIMLDSNRRIKLINMRTYKPNQMQDTCNLGTIGYAAPEQYGGLGQSDARTDIYGIGMTMYHLLTGIDPKEADFAVKPICQVNPSLPKGLEYIVEKSTQLDPANRYQSCVELQNDLNRYEQLPPKKNFLNKIFKH